jgi:hypothetical protein
MIKKIHSIKAMEKTFSERAKPEQSGDAKPRVLIKDSRVAEEMS